MDEKVILYPKGGGWYEVEGGGVIQLSKADIDDGNYEVRKPPHPEESTPVVEQPATDAVPDSVPEPLATVTDLPRRPEQITTWGPYSEYAIVHTPYGEYAVEVGYKMEFEPYTFFDQKEMTMRSSFRPVYTWALEDRNFGKTRDELIRTNVAPAPARF